jgi:uncharacterized protein YjiS (DUF1127 family)
MLVIAVWDANMRGFQPTSISMFRPFPYRWHGSHLQCVAMQARQPMNSASWRTTVSVLRLWRQRATTRRSLRHLNARELEDVGLLERDRAAECAKWFWLE